MCIHYNLISIYYNLTVYNRTEERRIRMRITEKEFIWINLFLSLLNVTVKLCSEAMHQILTSV